jgi:hypothetical protein
MSKAQQSITMDEVNAAEIEQLWVDSLVRETRPEQYPGEITSVRTDNDTNVTTIWLQGRPVAIAIRQRNAANYTVLTTVEIDRDPPR